MKQAPFEQFIKYLLEQAAASDVLRDLTEKDPNQGSSLLSSVDSMILEGQIASQFDSMGYSDPETYIKVARKLKTLETILINNHCGPNDEDLITVSICIKYVEDGYSLTKEAMECLNKIHKKYV